ncbi:hypothetical protein [Natronorubrum halophilum]|uniref:hypothetical protein n=1 Tax=Natronorubrum halophilum TaxID=1702106 RepID=UPI001EE97FE6|nr:hypothetical protein [Natronorubrum halophilum]
MAAEDSGPQPTAHEVAPGCSLDRRTFLQGTATAAAIAAGGAASSGTASAQSLMPIGAGWGAGDALGWLFGSDGDDDEEHEEYLENEILRIHGDTYRYGVETQARTGTSLTWVQDNAELLEGRAYIEGLKAAYREIQEQGASRQDAIDAATAKVDEVYSTPLEEIVNESHLVLRSIRDRWQRLHLALDEAGDYSEPADYEEYYRLASTYGSSDESAGGITDLDHDVSDMVYDLPDGSTISAPTFAIEFDNGQSATGATRDVGELGNIGLPALDPTPEDDGEEIYKMRDSDDANGWFVVETLEIEIKEFDDAEYRNVYDNEFGRDGEVAGAQLLWSHNDWNAAIQSVLDALNTASTNVETMVDNVYEQIVDDELSYEEIQTFTSLSDDAPEDDPHALVNAHLSMLGQTPSTTHNTITIGPLTDPDDEGPEANEDVAAIEGKTISGTLYIDPGPDGDLQVGETYTPADLTDLVSETTAAPTVLFSTTVVVENSEGEQVEQTGFVEFEDTREFTIDSAQGLNEDGEIVDTDSVTFTDNDLTTETPTDYEEVHDRLDEFEQFQKELLEQQYELVEEMNSDDDTEVDLTVPNPLDDLGEGGALLGLGLIGVVVLAVIGVVTDLIPGLGGN